MPDLHVLNASPPIGYEFELAGAKATSPLNVSNLAIVLMGHHPSLTDVVSPDPSTKPENDLGSCGFVWLSISSNALSMIPSWHSEDSQSQELGTLKAINEFRGEPYRVIRPIPVRFRRCDPSGIESLFEEANIAWVGEDWVEAYNGLQAEILNTLEDYEENRRRLGREPLRQLTVLRRFIERKY
ncbi:hypothetical protein MYX84_11225 [Acidobacteria bacterium AH-259-O06]|nr:hypothetical protein [Acidobacteria bacterium AH-259-O06]